MFHGIGEIVFNTTLGNFRENREVNGYMYENHKLLVNVPSFYLMDEVKLHFSSLT